MKEYSFLEHPKLWYLLDQRFNIFRTKPTMSHILGPNLGGSDVKFI